MSMFATKPIEQIQSEQLGEDHGQRPAARARTEPAHHARRRCHHRHRHLRPDRPGGRGECRTGDRAVDGPRRADERPGGAVLFRVRVERAGRGLGLHVCLCDARRVRRLDHRLGPHPRVRARRGHGRRRLVRQSRDAARPAGHELSRRAERRARDARARGRRRPGDGRLQRAGRARDRRGHGAPHLRRQRVGDGQLGHRRHQGRRRADRDWRRGVLHRSGQLAPVHPREHRPLRRVRLERRAARRRRHLLRLHRLRRRLDLRAGGEEPAARHAQGDSRIPGRLHGALRARLRRDGRPRSLQGDAERAGAARGRDCRPRPDAPPARRGRGPWRSSRSS